MLIARGKKIVLACVNSKSIAIKQGYVNIAQDCELSKAIKRQYKAKVILRKTKQGHSFLLAKAYERSHKSDNMYM